MYCTFRKKNWKFDIKTCSEPSRNSAAKTYQPLSIFGARGLWEYRWVECEQSRMTAARQKLTAARQKLSLLLSTAPPPVTSGVKCFFWIMQQMQHLQCMYYGVEVVRYVLLLMLFLFLSKPSQRSEGGLGSPENSCCFTLRLWDGWTDRAETWWDDQGHRRERPRKGIFGPVKVDHGQVGGPQVPPLGRGDDKETPNWE